MFPLYPNDQIEYISNPDFNNYTTPGNYWIGGNSWMENITNKPSNTSGNLLVFKMLNPESSGYVVQMYITHTASIFLRSCGGSYNWSSWKTITTQ